MASVDEIDSRPSDLAAEYELLRELGSGGSSVVFHARERATGRDVAIKVIRGGYAADREALARLAREARTVARLEHPNIVRVYEVRQLAGGGFALVMQYVPGRTLRDAMRRSGAAPLARGELVLRDVAQALAHAHALGIVHRDVKPENIFLDDTSGRALLSDFGIARSVEGDTDLTLTGVAIGTPTYMSPEQIDGARVDGRSDIYSLGIVGWEMLAGKRPWAGENLYSVIYRQKNEPLPRVRDVRPEVPESLQYAIDGALLKNRDHRLADADAFLAQLDGSPEAVEARERLAEAIVAERAAHPVLPPESTETVRFRRPVPIDYAATEPPPPARRRVAGAAALFVVAALAAAAAIELRRDEQPPPAEVATASAPAARRPARVAEDSAGSSVVPDTIPTGAALRAATPAIPPESVVAVPSADQPAALRVGTPADSSRTRAAPIVAGPSAAPVIRAAPTTGTAPSPGAADTQVAAGGVAEPARPAASTPEPAPPPRVARASLAAGGLHSCLLSHGIVYCWGSNDAGQLGDGSRSRRASPTRIAGEVRMMAVSAGISHTCSVGTDGKVYCWGNNDRGQLGDGTANTHPEPAPVDDLHGVAVVRAGMSHTCALTSDGDAYCWGANQYGQLGDGGRADRRRPVRVRQPEPFADLALGWGHTCALSRSGAVYCWGQNASGQLGDGTTADRAAPVRVGGEQRFTSVAAGSRHACATGAQGELYCWGQNGFGQLGDGTTADRTSPVRVAGLAAVSAVAAGSVHTCSLTRGGDAYCWGRNIYGQVGDGTTTDRAAPTSVQGGHAFSMIQANGAHTCGTTPSGESFCWGYNVEGQLGDGSRTHRARPVYVEKPTG